MLVGTQELKGPPHCITPSGTCLIPVSYQPPSSKPLAGTIPRAWSQEDKSPMVNMSPSCLKFNHRAMTKDLRPSSPESEQKVMSRSPSRDPR